MRTPTADVHLGGGVDRVRCRPPLLHRRGRGRPRSGARQFEDNLRAIVAAASDAGVAVVLCTVPSNEKGLAPEPDLVAGDAGRRGSCRRDTRDRTRQRKPTSPPTIPRRRCARWPRSRRHSTSAAGAWYEKGRALLALGRIDEAAAAFVAARDFDGQPGRAIGSLNDTIRRRSRDETAAPCSSISKRRFARSPDGIPGFDLFEDYVHPKPGAHVLIAREVWRAQTGSDDEDAFLAALDLPADFDYTSDATPAPTRRNPPRPPRCCSTSPSCSRTRGATKTPWNVTAAASN